VRRPSVDELLKPIRLGRCSSLGNSHCPYRCAGARPLRRAGTRHAGRWRRVRAGPKRAGLPTPRTASGAPHALSSHEGKPLASIFPPAAVGHAGESARDLPGERGPAGGSRLVAWTAPALQAKLDAHSEVLVGIAQQLAPPPTSACFPTWWGGKTPRKPASARAGEHPSHRREDDLARSQPGWLRSTARWVPRTASRTATRPTRRAERFAEGRAEARWVGSGSLTVYRNLPSARLCASLKSVTESECRN